MKVLLVTPPMSDLNTPYPATAYLTGFLRENGIEAHQADWSIELACRLFSKKGLERLLPRVHKLRPKPRPRVDDFLTQFDRYLETVEPVVAFLQGRNPGLESDILASHLLPEGPRLRTHREQLEKGSPKAEAFWNLGKQGQAHHLASLYLLELSDIFHHTERGFYLISYARKLPGSDFDKVLRFLAKRQGGLMSQLIEELTVEGLNRLRPDVLGLTAPFQGNLVGALRIAQVARRHFPGVKIVLGGGFPNTCMRELTDPRLFDFVDFLALDDGERPLMCLLEHLAGERGPDRLLRTFCRQEGKVVYNSATDESDLPFNENATPTYAGLPLDRYMGLMWEPTRSAKILSKRWNKLTLAHGCYWRKCTFCDISLDYVQRYEPQRVDRLIEQIKAIIDETGDRGFHWVDEAPPPSLLRALSDRLLEQKMAISWYGNIRFEKAFTPELARLMAKTGCVKVTGGLEVASDRLLKLMKKGVSVGQVARVAKGFTDQGIFVHAYLMYGFPTQTQQETVDSLELLRQLFAAGCLHSGYWHCFMATEHSPIGMNPGEYGIRLRPAATPAPERMFTRFQIPFEDPTGVDHEALGPGLWEALRSYERGLGLERAVHEWFSEPVPETCIVPDTIAQALAEKGPPSPSPGAGAAP